MVNEAALKIPLDSLETSIIQRQQGGRTELEVGYVKLCVS